METFKSKQHLFENQINSIRVRVGVWASKLSVASAVALCTVCTPAEGVALTIGGAEFTRMFTLNTGGDDFGLWSRADKFYTFIDNDNYLRANRVSSVTNRADDLRNTVIKEVNLMGTTNPEDTKVETAVLDLRGAHGEVLIKGTYASSGLVSYTLASGRNGQLNVSGIFNVTGGSLLQQGLITSSFYLTVAYDYVWKNSIIDLKTTHGTWNFYERASEGPPPPPDGEVPEPLSALLLGSGLVFARRLKESRV